MNLPGMNIPGMDLPGMDLPGINPPGINRPGTPNDQLKTRGRNSHATMVRSTTKSIKPR
ncbi:hypothetical protein LGQ02_18440 [Bacillus shivajii]|uniref:hypothetical protein n=1 Tax=Bacillus shivajii TaxID=1983719 RepID=UPI001CFB1CA1|nr:hypothetical protein [Bacillus shivajii]UCZ52739.1 hypothetical protein LGQ02_18440 [Bacillus shivajii]